MTAPPPIKSVRGRPAVELAGATGINPGPNSGTGLVVLCGEFGDGKNTATVEAGTFGETPRIPFGITFDRWEVLAYDAAGAPLAITCDILVEATDFGTNSFGSIVASDHPLLASLAKNDGTALTGWTVTWPVDTMYRIVLVSFTGAPAKIVVGIRGNKA